MRRYTPFEEFETLFDRMRHGFGAADERFGLGAGRFARTFDADVRTDDDAVVVMADLPGFDRDDIAVSLDGRTLTIRAERVVDAEQGDDDAGYVRRERRSTSVSRSLGLPVAVDDEGAEATYHNGVLTVTLPRADGGDGGVSISVE